MLKEIKEQVALVDQGETRPFTIKREKSKPRGTCALILHFVVTSSQRTSKGAELQLQLTSGLKGAPKLARRSVGRRQDGAHCEMPGGRVDAHDKRERIFKDLRVNIKSCAYRCDVRHMIVEGPSSLWGHVHDI